MCYEHIFCGWSKRLKPSESRRAFIRSAGLRFAEMLTSALGPSRHFDGLPMTSDLPPEADIVTAGRHVSKVPISDIASAHSITSSARARRDAGTSRPSDFAVLRLMTSAYLEGCSIVLLENAWAWETSTWLTWRKARFSS